jgi:hypothetical protein
MTGVWGLGALSRAFGSLPRPLNNKSIRHGKVGKPPSLRGAKRRGNPGSFNVAAKPPEILLGRRDAVIQAAVWLSGNAGASPRPFGLPRAFGPRNDGDLRLGALLRAFGSLPRVFDNKSIRHGKTGKTPSLRGAKRRGNPESFTRRRSRRKYCNSICY